MPQPTNKTPNKRTINKTVNTPKKEDNKVLARNINKENEKRRVENLHKEYSEKEPINDESDSTGSSSTESDDDTNSVLSTTINEELCEQTNESNKKSTEENIKEDTTSKATDETKNGIEGETKNEIKVNTTPESNAKTVDNTTKEPTIEVIKQGRRLNIKRSNDVIYFNSRNKKYSFLSNFYPSKLLIDGKEYWHVEGYYQSQKFAGINKSAEEHIRTALSPALCKKIAYSYPLHSSRRKEWDDELKERVMKKGVLCKFATDRNLTELLTSTEGHILVEDNIYDEYWANGTGGRGLNKLGNILMNVRDVLIKIN